MTALFAQTSEWLYMPSRIGNGALAAAAFGVIGIILLLLGYWVPSRGTP